MKKTLVITSITVATIILTWCNFFNKEETPEERQERLEKTCVKSSGIVWSWEYWDVCYYDDNSFCNLTTLSDWECTKWEKFEEVKYTENEAMYNCPFNYEPVCGKDWITYMNKCFLERWWVEEDKEATISENGWCVFPEK